MKKTLFAIALLCGTILLSITSCKEETPADPCEGKGVVNISNKLDSAISVKITETHNTVTIQKDFTMPFSLEGNQPYTFTIDGPQYHKDTTLMVLFCDNTLFIVKN